MDANEWHAIAETYAWRFSPMVPVDSQYGGVDCDGAMFLAKLGERPGAKCVEVGANESPVCRVLADAGYDVLGIDLRAHDWRLPHNYKRMRGDFVELAPLLVLDFEFAVCLSASGRKGLAGLQSGIVGEFVRGRMGG